MGTLSVKLPPALEAKLDALVKRRKQRKSVVIREAIERLVENSNEPAKGSVLDIVKDLKGVYDGPRDLSTNPKHMRGYGK